MDCFELAKMYREERLFKERLQRSREELARIEAKVHLLNIRAGFDPNQPRVPSGSPEGGQWTDGGGGSGRSNNLTGARISDNTGNGRISSDLSGIAKPKPKVVEHSVNEVSIHYSDKEIETRIGGTRAWRNNNPGNLRSGAFANRYGAVGNAGGFAVFPDEETGHRASVALLKSPNYINLTVNEAIARRSPNNENDTSRTQYLIRQISKLSGGEKIGSLNKSQLDSLAEAIKRTEGWKAGTISRSRAE